MRNVLVLLLCCAAAPAGLAGQVDQSRAATWFAEADALCRRDNGRLWGVSLCGPMVFADRATQTRATNAPAPDGAVPPLVGLVNAPVQWGGQTWAAFVWSMVPADDPQLRGRLLVHELFHRVQRDMGMFLMQPANDHLDQLEGRYWLRLEWRALSRALGSDGPERQGAIADALAFRARRRALHPGMAVREHADEIREGLAQYTGTVIAAPTAQAAVTDAIAQLAQAEREPTFVRTFAYSSGAAYGVLLDAFAPGWPRHFKPDDDLGELLQTAAKSTPAADPDAATRRYGGPALRAEEETRDAEQKRHVAELRERFVNGPLLIVPRGRNAMLRTTGATPIPGEGTVFMEYSLTAPWGTISATGGLLESSDGATLRVPGPFTTEGNTLRGEGWEVTVADGWVVRPGPRPGDFTVEPRGGSGYSPSQPLGRLPRFRTGTPPQPPA